MGLLVGDSPPPVGVKNLIGPASANPVDFPQMQNSFLQKLVLVILAGALTAGLYEFYKTFVEGGMNAVNGGYTIPGAHSTPRPTPRRY